MQHAGRFWKLSHPLDTHQFAIESDKAVQFGKLILKDKGHKGYLGASHRTISPRSTLTRLSKKKRQLAGITRVADITDLDVIGIPTYVAIRPEACFATPVEEGRISIYNGKGFTKYQAKASALMEAFERCSGEPFRRKPIIASYRQMKKTMPSVNPKSLNFDGPMDTAFQTAPIEWMIGIDLFTSKPTAVPAANVFTPYISPPGTVIVNPAHSSNGLASGNTLLEATVHGLLEIIERHGTSPNAPGVSIFDIAPEEIKNKWVLLLIQKLRRHGISIGLKYYKTRLNVSICRASIDDPITKDPVLLCYGTGCHLSKDVALVRALTEAVQTRLTVITGTREDIELPDSLRNDHFIYDELCKKFRHYFEVKNLVPYHQLPHFEFPTLSKDLSFILKRLKESGFDQVVAVNLTRADLEIPVVRVVVPNLYVKLQPHDYLFKAALDVKQRSNSHE